MLKTKTKTKKKTKQKKIVCECGRVIAERYYLYSHKNSFVHMNYFKVV
jgi:hypothetical protein